MIDYEKLKLAHNLYPQGYLKIIPIFDNNGELEYMNYSIEIQGQISDYFFTIDDLIAKLKELTRPKHKYHIGQEVWYTWNDEIKSSKIEELEIDAYNKPMYTTDANYHLKEQHLYPTKESLIDAQINYWLELVSDAVRDEMNGYKSNVPDYSICRMEEYQDHTEDNLEKVCKHAWIGGDAYKFCYHCKIVKSCDHEDDGNIYASNPPQNKCKKCGEFYK